ncbi:hypothetical protein GNY06_05970 [Elizabethkingia argentiflava]|uniref:Uncharacterized protein n=1 Tax=Elizabethkingia argenteiflava TaxID=2681556 RepID=A0A845PVP9_9FLAO|nr:hypothetical protein [Elizabethkingia argenteiflava]NAW50936.1 hypothetical protein [Elizabethkingia argenteiflava]
MKNLYITFKKPIIQRKLPSGDIQWQNTITSAFCILGANDHTTFFDGENYWVYKKDHSPIVMRVNGITHYLCKGETVDNTTFVSTYEEITKLIEDYFFPFIEDIKKIEILKKDQKISLN